MSEGLSVMLLFQNVLNARSLYHVPVGGNAGINTQNYFYRVDTSPLQVLAVTLGSAIVPSARATNTWQCSVRSKICFFFLKDELH